MQFSKINKRAGWNKAVQDGIFQKINKISRMIIRETRVHIILKSLLVWIMEILYFVLIQRTLTNSKGLSNYLFNFASLLHEQLPHEHSYILFV